MIAGLFPFAEGTIQVPAPRHIAYVPQRPYAFKGTIREQLMYPSSDTAAFSDENIATEMGAVGLEYLTKRFGLDTEAQWDNILSLGEQQRLAIARVLLRRPSFCIMDEGTSALNLELEAQCLQRLLDNGVTLVSVAHRPSVERFHKVIVTFTKTGNWNVKNI